MRNIAVFLLVFIFIAAFCTNINAADTKLQKQIDKATKIINDFKEMPETSIPPSVINNCKGLAVISVIKGGFIIGARGGSGIVIAKVPSTGEWSAPASIALGGVSFGFQIGAEGIDYVLVLNTDAAVKALSQNNCTLGADVSVAAGPVGRTVGAAATVAAPIFTYSRSKGVFAGVSLEGAIISEESKRNEEFYGHPVAANQILNGEVPQPATAENLYNALAAYGIPEAEEVSETEKQ